MSVLPVVHSIGKARLPETYRNAKVAIAECSRIDECKDWADKAEALASYAKQAGDKSLQTMANRIQARAMRQCGVLLLAIKRARAGRPGKIGKGTLTNSRRNRAAKDAGLSTHQKRTALRVANVPAEQFEAEVEADNPPTVTALANIGKQKAPEPTFDLRGRDPEEFKLATHALAALRRFAEMAAETDPATIARGSFDSEWGEALQYGETVILWVKSLMEHVREERAKRE